MNDKKVEAYKKLKRYAVFMGVFALILCELCSVFYSKKLMYLFWTGNIALIYLVYELFMLIRRLRICPNCKAKKFLKRCKSCGFEI